MGSLHGRDAERRLIGELLAGARAGRSGSLILVGEPGVGKSALLADAGNHAHGVLLLRASGVESESELAFATLHQLLRPVLPLLGRLPGPQARALEAALGLTSSTTTDRFLVGAGLLSLLAEAAEARPVLCVVDDLHWADQPSLASLAFAARRLEAEGVLLLMAAHDQQLPPEATERMPRLTVTGLDQAAASALLADSAGRQLSPHVRDQIIAATGGNPLALTEVPAVLSEAQLAGDSPVPDPLPVGPGTLRAFTERVARLDLPARTALLLAAAGGQADARVLFRVLDHAGIDRRAVRAAQDAGLLSVHAGSVVFRHPLIRSAVYQSAHPSDRRSAHRKLAAALSQPQEEDRRVWHLAAAAEDTDEHTAAALEKLAERSGRRAGYAAAATAWERAAVLSPYADRRDRRFVSAAEAAWLAGQVDRARALLQRVDVVSGDAVTVARAKHVLGRLESTCGVEPIGFRLLVDGARGVAGRNADLAAAMLLEATQGPWLAGDLRRVAEVARGLAQLPGERDAREGGVIRFAAGAELFLNGDIHGASVVMREMLHRASVSGDHRSLIMAAVGALVIADDAAALEFAGRAVNLARTGGMVGWLPLALMTLATTEAVTSRYAAAASDAAEGLRLAQETGQRFPDHQCRSVLAFVAAVRGDEAGCREHADSVIGNAFEHSSGPSLGGAAWALALLDLGHGRADQALGRLLSSRSGSPSAGHPVACLHSAGDLIEAAVRANRPQVAREALWGDGNRLGLARWAEETSQPWARAVAARSRALLAWATAAEDPRPHFIEAVELHRHGSRPFELARTELAYGEWLRRVPRRPSEARTHLHAALTQFTQLKAAPWAERSRHELRASGVPIEAPHPPRAGDLTPQERQIACLAAIGKTNRDIAGELFLSPRTVGYHLRKVFAKLGISARAQLAGLDLDRDAHSEST